MNALKSLLAEQGLADGDATIVAALVAVALVGLLSVLAYVVAKRILLRLVTAAAKRTKTHWDDAFVAAGLFSRLSHLVPALIVYGAAPVVLVDYPRAASTVLTGTSVYMALVGMTIFDALLKGGQRIYQSFEVSQRFSIRTIVQIVRVAVYFVVGIAVLAILLGKSPVVFFSGLGAFTAVLLLIFKDTLLGFVAGIQLTANNMVREGDWIEMPAQNADGTVLDVSLTTVKVQNWDKTITTIPTYPWSPSRSRIGAAWTSRAGAASSARCASTSRVSSSATPKCCSGSRRSSSSATTWRGSSRRSRPTTASSRSMSPC